jgi:hypothetical protein
MIGTKIQRIGFKIRFKVLWKTKQKKKTDIKGSFWNQEPDNTSLRTIIVETTWTLWLEIGDFQTHSWKEVSNLELIWRFELKALKVRGAKYCILQMT